MPDETHAGEETQQEQQPTQTGEDTTESTGTEDREPGGNDAQAVRARKEYRARKKLETELADERRKNIATEARLKALEEVRQQKETPTKVYTPAELQTAIDAGTLTVTEAANYLAEQRAKEMAANTVKQERARAEVEYKQQLAQSKVDSYLTVAPWLKDTSDSRRHAVEQKYDELTNPNGAFRLPHGPTTDALALEMVLGPVDKLKARTDLANRSRGTDTHVESGAGGTGASRGQQQTQDPDLAKMPQHFKDFWDKTQTPVADRKKEAAIYFSKRGK